MSTARSISPSSDDTLSCQPCQRIFSATTTASSGSRICQPVAMAPTRPAMTPIDVTTSVIMCLPSAVSAGDLLVGRRAEGSLPRQRSSPAAPPLTARPVQGCSSGWIAQHVPDLGKDQQCRNDDQHALKHGGEIFGFVMAVLVVAVGGLVADLDRPEGRSGGNHIDDRFQRIRIKRHRSGDPPGEGLQRQNER